MKSVFKISLLAAAVVFASGCQKEENAAETKAATTSSVQALKTEDQKASYAIGSSLAKYLKDNIDQQKEIGIQLDTAIVMQGVNDVFNNNTLMTEEETQNALEELDKRITTVMQKQAEEKAIAAKKAGEEFRKSFGENNDVSTTESGLMYRIDRTSTEEGQSKKPTAEDTVVVHYKGTLTDGTQFDSSYDRNQPATFTLNQVIPGWIEGVQLMPVGSKFTFVIPPELAYGEQNTPTIPANSTLVFEVELLEIQAKEAEKSQG